MHADEPAGTRNGECLLNIPSYIECVIRRRLNRFVVEISVDGRGEHAHINNTGRLLELLVSGRKAACLPSPGGKTSYKLFAIESHRQTRNTVVRGTLSSEHSEREGKAPAALPMEGATRAPEIESASAWTLIDTQFQMRAFERALAEERIEWLSGWRLQRRNPRLGDSVLDYALVKDSAPGELYIEVKSAALQQGRYAMYPDCLTLRGQRHIRVLIDHARRKLRGAICFIAAFKDAAAFRPFEGGDPAVAALLRQAAGAGVEIRAVSLYFDGKGIQLGDPDLPVHLF
ncbi:MAG TPA: DNA/RNA nuclease SfsA [Syntrophorhabdales bacterium]|nr:DNA/RNA nuclease SfsA [Syntrophorhabdales bacterium]